MHLAITDLFRAKWTDEIHEEWITGLLKQRCDLNRKQLERTRDLMNARVRDCLVTGYQSLISAITLPDPKDRHVLAASIKSGADMIVTYNLKDFPEECLAPYGIEAAHPDDFVNYQLDFAPNIVCAAAKRHRESLKKPQKSVADYLESLERQGLTQTVSGLKQYAALI
jgi:hypothetical protein